MKRSAATDKWGNRRHRSVRLTLFVGLLGFSFLSGDARTPLASPNDYCDTRIKTDRNDRDRYMTRGDRCEGTYVEQVAGDGYLTIKSFTEGTDETDPMSGRTLWIQWNRHSFGPTRIQATSLKPKKLYRMDTELPEGVDSYAWETDLLKHHLSAGDYGLLGIVSTGKADAYIPLQVESAGKSASAQSYQIYLYTIAQPAELYLTLATVKADGTPGKALTSGKALKRGPYPREGKIPLRLDHLSGGLYHVLIAADLENGNSTSLTFWLYVP